MSDYFQTPLGDFSQAHQVKTYINNLKAQHNQLNPQSIVCKIIGNQSDTKATKGLHTYSFSVEFQDQDNTSTHVFLARMTDKDAIAICGKEPELKSETLTEKKIFSDDIKSIRKQLKELKKFPDLKKEAQRLDLGLKHIQSKLSKASTPTDIHKLYSEYGRLRYQSNLDDIMSKYSEALNKVENSIHLLNEIVLPEKKLQNIKDKILKVIDEPINATNLEVLHQQLQELPLNSDDFSVEDYQAHYETLIKALKTPKPKVSLLKGIKYLGQNLAQLFSRVKKYQEKFIQLEAQHLLTWYEDNINDLRSIIPEEDMKDLQIYVPPKKIKHINSELNNLVSCRIILQSKFKAYRLNKSLKEDLITKSQDLEDKIAEAITSDKNNHIHTQLNQLKEQIVQIIETTPSTKSPKSITELNQTYHSINKKFHKLLGLKYLSPESNAYFDTEESYESTTSSRDSYIEKISDPNSYINSLTEDTKTSFNNSFENSSISSAFEDSSIEESFKNTEPYKETKDSSNVERNSRKEIDASFNDSILDRAVHDNLSSSEPKPPLKDLLEIRPSIVSPVEESFESLNDDLDRLVQYPKQVADFNHYLLENSIHTLNEDAVLEQLDENLEQEAKEFINASPFTSAHISLENPLNMPWDNDFNYDLIIPIEEITDYDTSHKNIALAKKFIASELQILSTLEALEGSKLKAEIFSNEDNATILDYRPKLQGVLSEIEVNPDSISNNLITELHEHLPPAVREKITEALLIKDNAYDKLLYQTNFSFSKVFEIIDSLDIPLHLDAISLKHDLNRIKKEIKDELLITTTIKDIENDSSDALKKEISKNGYARINTFMADHIIPSYNQYEMNISLEMTSLAQKTLQDNLNPLFKIYIESNAQFEKPSVAYPVDVISNVNNINQLNTNLQFSCNYLQSQLVSLSRAIKDQDNIQQLYKDYTTNILQVIEDVNSLSNELTIDLDASIKNLNREIEDPNFEFDASYLSSFTSTLEKHISSLKFDSYTQILALAKQSIFNQQKRLIESYPNAFAKISPYKLAIFDIEEVSSENFISNLIFKFKDSKAQLEDIENQLFEITQINSNLEAQTQQAKSIIQVAVKNIQEDTQPYLDLISEEIINSTVNQFNQQALEYLNEIQNSESLENIIPKLNAFISELHRNTLEGLISLYNTNLEEKINEAISPITDRVNELKSYYQPLEIFAGKLVSLQVKKIDSALESFRNELKNVKNSTDITTIKHTFLKDLSEHSYSYINNAIQAYKNFDDNWNNSPYFHDLASDTLHNHQENIIKSRVNAITNSNEILTIQKSWVDKQLLKLTSIKDKGIDTSSINEKLLSISEHLESIDGKIKTKDSLKDFKSEIESSIENLKVELVNDDSSSIYKSSYIPASTQSCDELHGKVLDQLEALNKDDLEKLSPSVYESLNTLISSTNSKEDSDLKLQLLKLQSNFLESLVKSPENTISMAEDFFNTIDTLEDLFTHFANHIEAYLSLISSSELLNNTSLYIIPDHILHLKQQALQEISLDDNLEISITESLEDLYQSIDQLMQFTEAVKNVIKTTDEATYLFCSHLENLEASDSISPDTEIIIPGYQRTNYDNILSQLELIYESIGSLSIDPESLQLPIQDINFTNEKLQQSTLDITAFCLALTEDPNTVHIKNILLNIDTLAESKPSQAKKMLQDLRSICESAKNPNALVKSLVNLQNEYSYFDNISYKMRIYSSKIFRSLSSSSLSQEAGKKTVEHFTNLLKSSQFEKSSVTEITSFLDNIVNILDSQIEHSIKDKFILHLFSTIQNHGLRQGTWEKNHSSFLALSQLIEVIAVNPNVNIYSLSTIYSGLIESNEDNVISESFPYIEEFIQEFKESYISSLGSPKENIRYDITCEKLLSSIPSELSDTSIHIQNNYNAFVSKDNIDEVESIFIDTYAPLIDQLKKTIHCINNISLSISELLTMSSTEDNLISQDRGNLHILPQIYTAILDSIMLSNDISYKSKKRFIGFIKFTDKLLQSEAPDSNQSQLSPKIKNHLALLISTLFTKCAENPNLLFDNATYEKINYIQEKIEKTTTKESFLSFNTIYEAEELDTDGTDDFESIIITICDSEFSFEDIYQFIDSYINSLRS